MTAPPTTARLNSLRLVLALLLVVLARAVLAGQTSPVYAWRNLTGQAGGIGDADGPGAVARFFEPQSVAVDPMGTIYVADAGNNTIRKVTSGGVVTTLAGSPGLAGDADGTNNAAQFDYPSGVAVDGAGNVYVADTDNSTIRKVTPQGVVTTLAGTPGEPGSADGAGGVAQFNFPRGVAVDGDGTVYVADAGNNTIRKITSDGRVTTLAGNPEVAGSADGAGGGALFFEPSGVAVDGAGNVYVADLNNNAIRKVTPQGVVTTLAGLPQFDHFGNPLGGSADGTGAGAQFNFPAGVAVDGTGNVYVADTGNSTIRQVTTNGVVTTLAGNAGQTGSADGTNGMAGFDDPGGVAVGSGGNVYVADTGNASLRQVTAHGVVTTLAGSAEQAGSADVTGSAAQFNGPVGVAMDSAGNVFVADAGNSTLRRVTVNGVVTTLAGSAGVTGSVDGSNSAARFNNPGGVAVDAAGNLYVADINNDTIRKVTASGVVTTLAGSAGLAGSADGTNSTARFNNPIGVAVDQAGIVYVADAGNNTLREITSDGVVTSLAGSAGQVGSADGTNTTARFNFPTGVAVDRTGTVYVADSGNRIIRQVTASGVVTTLAGGVGQFGSADGTNLTARFTDPFGITLDSAGNLYVTDAAENTLRQITAVGVVTTLAGRAGQYGSADGTGSAARFFVPSGVAANGAGIISVADYGNSTIRQVTTNGVVTTLAGSAGQTGSADITGSAARYFSPGGVAVDAAGNVYVADTDNAILRKVTSDGGVTTLAGLAGQTGSADGANSAARFNYPFGLAVDGADNVYVADTYNSTLRKVTAGGVVTTLAGSPGQPGSANGTAGAAKFYYPAGVAVDLAGNIYVADTYNSTIRKVTTGGVVTTLAGSAGQTGSADGTGGAARFCLPNGVAVDRAGNVYVADTGNSTLRKVTSTGVVTTLAGSAGEPGSADGTNGQARFNVPRGVAVDGSGLLLVADTGNNTLRQVTAAGVVTTIGGCAGVSGGADGVGGSANFAGPEGVAVDGNGRIFVADAGNNRISMGTPRPVLSIARSGPELIVSWPATDAGFVLEQSPVVGDAADWPASGYAVTTANGTNRVTITPPPGNLFFRLANP